MSNLLPRIDCTNEKYLNEILSKAIPVSSVKRLDRDNMEVFKTGIPSLDSKVEIAFGKICAISGVNGCGKSTILGQLMLEAIEQGYKVFTYSGELKEDEFQHWIDLQAAGSEHLIQKTSKAGKQYYTIDSRILPKIHSWYDDSFWLYKNNESMRFDKILEVIEAYIMKHNTRVIFLDNFLTIDISNISEKELKAQTDFITTLATFAKTRNVLIFLVIHPKKIYEGIVTKADVLGSGNISNALDYLLLIHRVNENFKNHLKKRPISTDAKYFLENSSNIIEVGKDRWTGGEGLNVPLAYMMDSKRLIDIQRMDIKDRKYSWEKTQKKIEELGW